MTGVSPVTQLMIIWPSPNRPAWRVSVTSSRRSKALMVAAGHNNAPMIGLLLGKGANPALKNNLGKTALDVAREAHNDVAISALQLLSMPPPN